MAKTKIGWTEYTSNPIAGCNRISAGCDNCYAINMAYRLANMRQKKYQGLTIKRNDGKIDWSGKISIDINVLLYDVIKIKRPSMYFVPSMGDLFHKNVPSEIIYQILAVMMKYNKHIYQITTKRLENMKRFLLNIDYQELHKQADYLGFGLYPSEINFNNIWFGASIEDQKTFDLRFPIINSLKGFNTWLSIEPLLGPINVMNDFMSEDWDNNTSWIVVGGESGLKARPCKIEWIIDLVAQCKLTAKKVFVKQLGRNAYLNGLPYKYKKLPIRDPRSKIDHKNIKVFPKELRVREYPDFK